VSTEEYREVMKRVGRRLMPKLDKSDILFWAISLCGIILALYLYLIFI
jgi:hypothetical protein